MRISDGHAPAWRRCVWVVGAAVAGLLIAGCQSAPKGIGPATVIHATATPTPTPTAAPTPTATPIATPPAPTPTPAPSLTPRPAATPTPPPTAGRLAPELFFGPSAGGAIYITIDDGWYPDNRVITLMRQDRIPITTFLIADAASENKAFWQSFEAAGGTIEDHTINHPNLTLLSEAQAEYQWRQPILDYQKWFSTTPVVGRPPYGDVNTAVRRAAAQAGLKAVIMWTVTMSNGVLTTYDHRPMRAGEIVLLHWVPGLYSDLVNLLSMIQARGLHPAALLPALGY
jgi:peptidoglycan/xylan/chitin deacetylase (PgdA/CDA1 family)